VLLIVTEFATIRYVTVITATCSDFATPQLRDNCLVTGDESHYWAFALLGLFVILMTFGAIVGGSRPAAVALLVAGVAGLGITLLHDLPETSSKGQVGLDFKPAKAHKGTGFWLELVGSSLAIACGGFVTLRPPPPLRERLARARPGRDGAGGRPAIGEEPPGGEEPASA
jgi:hypothetical protein